VKNTFAGHGLKLADIERNRASTWSIPARLVRAWRASPALARPTRPHANEKYVIILITDRRWLDTLSQHQRAAERAIGVGRVDWSQTSIRRDNVLIWYPAGAPKNLASLKRILDAL
jgi:hypothetical protein